MLNSSLFWKIVTVASSVIELWTCKKAFNYTSEKKVSNIRVNIIMTLITIFMLSLLQMNIDPNIRIDISIVLTFSFYIINYDTNFYTGIIITLIYWMILLGIDALSMSLVIWVNSIDNMNTLLINNLYRLQSITMAKSILIVTVGLYKIIKIEIEVNKKDILYLGIPIIANIASFFIIFKYVFKFSQQNLISGFQVLNFSILLFLSNISLILVMRKIRLDSNLLAEYDLMKKNIDMQYKYYMNIKENQVKIRQLHHDMKNHIICIKKLNENGYDTEKYIENIENKLISYDNSFDTGNVLLDIILNEKKGICDSKNIKFYCNINFTKCNFIEIEDICCIFSNILDNAIEACEKINNNKKYISLEGKIVESFFVLKVENAKTNKINIKNNKVMTDKKDIFLHGLGIKNIKNLVKKYEGEAVIDYTNDRFILKILIPVVLYND